MKQEQNRSLSPAEQKRLAEFEVTAARLTEAGYGRRDLVVGIVWANVFSLLLGIPVMVAGHVLFRILHGAGSFSMSLSDALLVAGGFFVAVVVHELIHGVTWSIFAENHWKDIAFGYMKEYMTPYCACRVPLSRGGYVTGALMPLILMGILPAVLALLLGAYPWLLLGMVMILCASGDILVSWKILTDRTDAVEIIYMDHPTQAGGVIFERGKK